MKIFSYRRRVIQQLIMRDGLGCKLCVSIIALQIDHVIPIRTQDKNERERDLRHPDLDNLQLLCYNCHLQKSLIDAAS